MDSIKFRNTADLSGATVSILCAIHCAITPLLFLSMPLLDHAADHHHHHHHGPSFWGMLDWFFLVLSLVAVWYSAKHTLLPRVRILLWLFWGIFTAGIVGEMLGYHQLEWLVYFGSISLAVTHIFNFRHWKKCDAEAC